MYLVGGDFAFHCKLESLDPVHKVIAVFLKYLVKLLNVQRLKYYFGWGLVPNVLEWTTKKKEEATKP